MGKRICILSNLSGTPVWNPAVVKRQQSLIEKPSKGKTHVKLLDCKIGEWYLYEVKSGQSQKVYQTKLINDPFGLNVYSECTCGGGQVPIVCHHIVRALPVHKHIVLSRRKAKQKEYDERPAITGTITMQGGNFIVKVHNPYNFVKDKMRTLLSRGYYDEAQNLWDISSDPENTKKLRRIAEDCGLVPDVLAASALRGA